MITTCLFFLLICMIDSLAMDPATHVQFQSYSIQDAQDDIGLYSSSTGSVVPVVSCPYNYGGDVTLDPSKTVVPNPQFWIYKEIPECNMQLRVCYEENGTETDVTYPFSIPSDHNTLSKKFLCDGINQKKSFIAAYIAYESGKAVQSILYTGTLPLTKHVVHKVPIQPLQQMEGELTALVLHQENNICAYSYTDIKKQNYFCIIDLMTQTVRSAQSPHCFKRIVFNGNHYIGVTQNNEMVWACPQSVWFRPKKSPNIIKFITVGYPVKNVPGGLLKVRDIALYEQELLFLDHQGKLYLADKNIEDKPPCKATTASVSNLDSIKGISFNKNQIFVIYEGRNGDLVDGKMLEINRHAIEGKDDGLTPSFTGTLSYDLRKPESSNNNSFYSVIRMSAIPVGLLFLMIIYKYSSIIDFFC